MAARLARLHDRFSHGNGADSISGAISAASATPIFSLLEALRKDYKISEEDPNLHKIAEATVLHYLYLRLQDDIVDEPEQFDRGFVYLLQVLYDAGQDAFRVAFKGSNGFFEFQRNTMDRFANTALWEVDTVRKGDLTESDIKRLGDKFLPLAIPLGALAYLSIKPKDAPHLVKFAQYLGIGLQIVNDILNIQEDHKGKRLTPVLQKLYQSRRIEPGEQSNELRLLLITDPSIQESIQYAEDSMKEAEKIGNMLQMNNLVAVTQNRTGYIKSVPQRLLALQLGINDL